MEVIKPYLEAGKRTWAPNIWYSREIAPPFFPSLPLPSNEGRAAGSQQQSETNWEGSELMAALPDR